MGFQITFSCYNPCPPRQRDTGSLGNRFLVLGTCPPLLPSRRGGVTPKPLQGHHMVPPSTPAVVLKPSHLSIYKPPAYSISLFLGCCLKYGIPSTYPSWILHLVIIFLPRILLSPTILIFSLPLEGPKCPTQWLYQTRLLSSHRKHLSV